MAGILLLISLSFCKSTRSNLYAMCGRFLVRAGLSTTGSCWRTYLEQTVSATNTYRRRAARISPSPRLWNGVLTASSRSAQMRGRPLCVLNQNRSQTTRSRVLTATESACSRRWCVLKAFIVSFTSCRTERHPSLMSLPCRQSGRAWFAVSSISHFVDSCHNLSRTGGADFLLRVRKTSCQID